MHPGTETKADAILPPVTLSAVQIVFFCFLSNSPTLFSKEHHSSKPVIISGIN